MSAAPLLQYAQPNVFFAGTHRSRSASAIVMTLLLAGVGAAFALAGRWNWANAPLIAILFLIGGAVLLSYAAHRFYNVIVGTEKAMKITGDGIESGRTFWPWQRISSLHGSIFTNGVQVRCSIGRGKIQYVRGFGVTPALTEAEYAELASKVGDHLAQHHPHVEVAPRAVRDD